MFAELTCCFFTPNYNTAYALTGSICSVRR